MTKHTPTPNEVLTELAGVLHRIPQAHRDIIVTAVNSHEELLLVAKGFRAYLKIDGTDSKELNEIIAKAEGRI